MPLTSKPTSTCESLSRRHVQAPIFHQRERTPKTQLLLSRMRKESCSPEESPTGSWTVLEVDLLVVTSPAKSASTHTSSSLSQCSSVDPCTVLGAFFQCLATRRRSPVSYPWGSFILRAKHLAASSMFARGEAHRRRPEHPSRPLAAAAEILNLRRLGLGSLYSWCCCFFDLAVGESQLHPEAIHMSLTWFQFDCLSPVCIPRHVPHKQVRYHCSLF